MTFIENLIPLFYSLCFSFILFDCVLFVESIATLSFGPLIYVVAYVCPA